MLASSCPRWARAVVHQSRPAKDVVHAVAIFDDCTMRFFNIGGFGPVSIQEIVCSSATLRPHGQRETSN